MNISSVSSSSSYVTSSSTNDTSSLEKQKARLQAEINKLNQSNDSQETKEKRAQQLQQQIQQIDAQIAQKQQKSSSDAQIQTGAKEASANGALAKTNAGNDEENRLAAKEVEKKEAEHPMLGKALDIYL